MSRRIATLLNEAEETVTKTLAGLENKNTFPSHDARHIAEVHQQVRQKIADLGLDPDDTTAKELFQALQVRFDRDSRTLDDLSLNNPEDFTEKLAMAAQRLNTADLPNVWALKNTAAKRLLKQIPPKQVMKYLRYRSVDSMLKRENVCELMLAAQALESDSWQAKLDKLVSKLDQTELELRRLRVIALSPEKWSQVESETEVVTAEAAGALCVWPAEEVGQTSLLAVSLILLEEIEKYGVKISAATLFNSEILSWWTDMDHLLAQLNDGHVSLNLADVAASHRLEDGFDSRRLEKGRLNYWQSLIDRYEKKLETDGIFDSGLLQKARALNFKGPQPAFEFEYAEDL